MLTAAGSTSRPEAAYRQLLSLVIPALNEEQGIGAVIDEVPRDALRKMGWDVEVLVVDGESADRTRDIATQRGARVIVEPRKGYGRAYKTGFARAKGDVIATADADLTYPVSDLPQLLELFEREKLDFLTTDRFADLEQGAMRTKHRVGNWVLSTAARVLFMRSIRDSQSGMWLLRRSALDKLVLTADGMPFSEEIKLEAFRHPALRSQEVPIRYRVRVGEVKLQSWDDGVENLVFLLRKRFGFTRPEADG
ncbi:MAG: glycosyltransferase family 2 protein [Halobacteriales archaeon]|nr:glycosyltransferase family 2 protein [Halobacteriales archaeon]